MLGFLRMIGAIFFALVLTACATPQQKEIPTGPSARLIGSSTSSKMKMGENSTPFKSDGFYPDNSDHSLDQYYVPKGSAYFLPVGKALVVRVIGRRDYAMPIVALVSNIYEIKGEVTFIPVADHLYTVRGVLSETASSIWIEDTNTGEVVGKKIEVGGSTAIGIFEK